MLYYFNTLDNHDFKNENGNWTMTIDGTPLRVNRDLICVIILLQYEICSHDKLYHACRHQECAKLYTFENDILDVINEMVENKLIICIEAESKEECLEKFKAIAAAHVEKYKGHKHRRKLVKDFFRIYGKSVDIDNTRFKYYFKESRAIK